MCNMNSAIRSLVRSHGPARALPRRAAAALLPGVLAASLLAGAPAHAAPVVPDDVPAWPGYGPASREENPHVEVTFEDGTPVAGHTVHRGDVLIVHGSGFDPNANRGGFPLPVPPGVPNGVYVLYSAFPDHWRPSEGAPSESRTHPHDRMAWVMPPGTLERVPGTGVNMRRTLARSAQPMNEEGEFAARIVVDPPEHVPGDNWGVYVYAAAGSVNEAEEIYVPIPYSPEPGPNTPPPSSADLVFDVSVLEGLADATMGAVVPKTGAVDAGEGEVGYTYAGEEIDPDTGYGTVRYRGTVQLQAKFSLVDVVVTDPWIEIGPYGTRITAEVSERPDVGPDQTRRIPIAVVAPDAGSDATAGAQPGVIHTSLGEVRRVR